MSNTTTTAEIHTENRRLQEIRVVLQDHYAFEFQRVNQGGSAAFLSDLRAELENVKQRIKDNWSKHDFAS